MGDTLYRCGSAECVEVGVVGVEEESGSQIGVKGGVGGGVGRLVWVDLWPWVLCLLWGVSGVVLGVCLVGV